MALSRRTHRLVTRDLAIAATVILVLVSIDFVGHLPLPLGVLGREGSTVIVGLNGPSPSVPAGLALNSPHGASD